MRKHVEITQEAVDCEEGEQKDENKSELKNHIKTTHEANNTPSNEQHLFSCTFE